MSKHGDAELILKLYDLRREEVMRNARRWFISEFHPGSMEDVRVASTGETSPYFRMVIGYWEMAASLVTNGALDEKMFNDANGEHIAVFSKLEPFLPQMREVLGMPMFMEHLEKVVMNIPDAQGRLNRVREMLKQVAPASAAKA